MNWQPIETYDALKKKPERAVFYFKATPPNHRGNNALRATIETTRTYGSRVCVFWLELPPPPMILEQPA